LANKNRKLKDEQIELKSRLTTLEGLRSGERQLKEIFPEAADPMNEVMVLKRFADAAIELKQSNPDVNYAIDLVLKTMRGERMSNSTEKRQEPAKPDPKLDAIASKLMRSEVEDFAKRAQISPNFRQAVANGIVRRIPADKVGQTSDAMFKEALKGVLEENGWSVATIRSGATSEASTVKTGKKGAAALTPQTPKDKAKAEAVKPQPPKSLREWQDEGKQVVSSIMDQLSGDQNLI
jgi:hypothetical protein